MELIWSTEINVVGKINYLCLSPLDFQMRSLHTNQWIEDESGLECGVGFLKGKLDPTLRRGNEC